MATFVLVHGAWSGGWMWRYTRRLLAAHGHEVYTPTLTGLGERSHLASPSVDLTTHITDVVNVPECEELRDVVLVGHSYGGIVVTAVADRAAERVAQMIYLDAFVPDDGQALADIVPQVLGMREGWLIPPLPRTALGRIEAGGLPADDIWRLVNRRGPQPLKTFTEPVRLTNPDAPGLARSYIYCADKEREDAFTHFARRFAADPHWRTYEIMTDHYPMLTTPHELTDLLIAVASGSSPPLPAPATGD